MEESNGKSIRDIINRALDVASQNGGWDFITNFLSPGYQQEKEFGQQVALTREAQDFAVDYSRRMREMRKAGINPFTAAEGLAGASTSPATPSVPSSAVGEGAASIGQAAGAIGSIAGAGTSLAEAKSVLSLIEPTIDKLTSETSKNLIDIGLTEEQIYAWRVDNKYRDLNSQVDLRIKGLTADNLAKEWEVMHSSYELNLQMLDESLARINLMKTEEGVNAANEQYITKMKEKYDLENQWQQIRIDFWKRNGYDILNSSTDAILVQKIENGESVKEIIKEMSNYYEKTFFSQEKGRMSAQGLFGTAKSPWELGDKYVNRLVDWVRSNIEDNPDIAKEQIYSLMDSLQSANPTWDRDRIIKELYSLGFTKQEVYNALNN